jgi:CBS domain-containing protein
VGSIRGATPVTIPTESPSWLVALPADDGSDWVVVGDDHNQLVGVLTTTDFVDIVAKSKPKADTTVERYMTTSVVTTTAQASTRDVADTMMEHGFHHVPVVDDEEGVIGMISTTDLAAYISTAEAPSPA